MNEHRVNKKVSCKRLANKRRYAVPAVGVWAAIIVFGSIRLMAFDTTAAEAKAFPQTSSPSAHAKATDARTAPFKLIICLHPLCPCSKATVTEVGQLLKTSDGQLSAEFVFVVPQGVETNPVGSALWKQAAALPHSTARVDFTGKTIAELAATASGQTYLFDQDGVLRFSGGVTATRGKIGDNEGRCAILDVLQGKTARAIQTPVYGCELQ